jgi:hypothetical protein
VVAMKTKYAGPDGPRFLTSSPMSQALRRIGSQQAGSLTTESGEVWHPANLLLQAADEIDALRDALHWCGGSPSFAPDGEAHEGWKAIVGLLM